MPSPEERQVHALEDIVRLLEKIEKHIAPQTITGPKLHALKFPALELEPMSDFPPDWNY